MLTRLDATRFQTTKKQDGFGLIEVMVFMAVMSVVLVATAMFSISLQKQVTNIADLTVMKNYKYKFPAMISDDFSWKTIVNNNPQMACLSNGGGASCPVMTRGNTFALYDMSGGLVHGNSSNDGLTLKGIRCGPHAKDFVFQQMKYGDVACPLKYTFEWVALTNDPYPIIAVIVTLSVAKNSKGGPVVDMNIDTSNYDFSYPTNSPWPPNLLNPSPQWTGLLFRKAI
jgi:prepilin-type N-terminal cleavage/methylation domain-containing protein